MRQFVRQLLETIGMYVPGGVEGDLVFAEHLRERSRFGLRAAGVLIVLGPLIFAVGSGLAQHWTMSMSVDSDPGTLAIWLPLLASLLGIALALLSYTSVGQRQGRLILAVTILIVTILGSLEFLAQGIHHPSKYGILALLMILAVSTMPYRAWHTVLLGIAVFTTYGLAALIIPNMYGKQALTIVPELPLFMLTTTGICAGISALLYAGSYRSYCTQSEQETLRRRVEESERRYRSIFEDSADGIFVYSERTKGFVLVNHVIEDILGLSADELSRTHFSRVIHPDDLERVGRYHAARIRGESAPTRYTVKLIRHGSDEPVICDMTIHRSDDPKTTSGAIRDITKRVQLEAENAQLARLPATSPFPVLRFSYDGDIVYRNPAAHSFAIDLGHPEATIVDFLPEDFAERIRRLIDTDTTLVDTRHDALGKVLSISYRPVPETNQVFVWILDVTERVQAEQRIRSYAQELEEINSELRETQTQLIQSEKMAALGTLVAGVAHEINTPVGSIHANADVSKRALEILRTADRAPAATQKIERAIAILEESNTTTRTATERIVRIVRSLRNFARLDEAELKEVDLHEGIDSTLTLAYHEYKHRVEIVRDYGDLPRVECFPNQLNQVFMNVIVNATHAIKDKGTITIRTRAEGDHVTVAISDTGVGIQPEHRQRVFDPGFTTKGVGVGTGLGLSIVYKIIQAHYGTISVDSTPGKGTTFLITVPIRRPPVEHT